MDSITTAADLGEALVGDPTLIWMMRDGTFSMSRDGGDKGYYGPAQNFGPGLYDDNRRAWIRSRLKEMALG